MLRITKYALYRWMIAAGTLFGVNSVTVAGSPPNALAITAPQMPTLIEQFSADSA
jgi:hypothetical protein